MNLRDLSAEIARHAATLHALTDTNILGIVVVGNRITFEFDNHKMEQQLSEANMAIESLRNKRDDLTRQCAGLERNRIFALKSLTDATRALTP